jgi:hypothetical protein
MNYQIDKILADLKKTVLQATEKNAIRQKLLARIRLSHTETPLSGRRTLFGWRYLHAVWWFRPAVFGLAITIAFGGVSFAAEQALPTDPLYFVKTKINEPVARAFTGASPVKQADFEVKLAEKRLTEVEELVTNQPVEERHREEIKERVVKQVARAAAAESKIKRQNKPGDRPGAKGRQFDNQVKEQDKRSRTLENVLEKHEEAAERLDIKLNRKREENKKRENVSNGRKNRLKD